MTGNTKDIAFVLQSYYNSGSYFDMLFNNKYFEFVKNINSHSCIVKAKQNMTVSVNIFNITAGYNVGFGYTSESHCKTVSLTYVKGAEYTFQLALNVSNNTGTMILTHVD